MSKMYFIVCLNPDCAEDDSSLDDKPNACQFCGCTDIEVTDGGDI